MTNMGRNILEGCRIFRRVVKSFRGFEKYFGGFYKTIERGLKNFGGTRGGQRKPGGTGKGRKVGRAVREDRLLLVYIEWAVSPNRDFK